LVHFDKYATIAPVGRSVTRAGEGGGWRSGKPPSGLRSRRRVFSDDVAALLQQETTEWLLEFQSSLLRLERSNTSRSGSVPLHGAVEP
jgi:hypothetical protein